LGGLVWAAAIDGFSRNWDPDTGKVVYESNLRISKVV